MHLEVSHRRDLAQGEKGGVARGVGRKPARNFKKEDVIVVSHTAEEDVD